jgi:hypothetical protein
MKKILLVGFLFFIALSVYFNSNKVMTTELASKAVTEGDACTVDCTTNENQAPTEIISQINIVTDEAIRNSPGTLYLNDLRAQCMKKDPEFVNDCMDGKFRKILRGQIATPVSSEEIAYYVSSHLIPQIGANLVKMLHRRQKECLDCLMTIGGTDKHRKEFEDIVYPLAVIQKHATDPKLKVKIYDLSKKLANSNLEDIAAIDKKEVKIIEARLFDFLYWSSYFKVSKLIPESQDDDTLSHALRGDFDKMPSQYGLTPANRPKPIRFD